MEKNRSRQSVFCRFYWLDVGLHICYIISLLHATNVMLVSDRDVISEAVFFFMGAIVLYGLVGEACEFAVAL